MLMNITSFGGVEKNIPKEKNVTQNRFYIDIFKWMFMGLMITAGTAFITTLLGAAAHLSYIHIFFALGIYLDFLTIFLYVLRLVGIKLKD